MFLQVMNQEEKEKFLELIYKVANVDGDYAEEEQEMVNNYKIELGIDTIGDTNSIDELVKYFASKSDSLKKIVMFETIGIVNADNKVAKEEADLLALMQSSFAIEAEIVDKINLVAKKLQDVYDEVYDLLFD